MYHTPKGIRILLGAERKLFEQSLGMIVDFLATGDLEFGIELFDQLQPNQKLFVLYNSGRGLLRPDEPPPKITAGIEAAIATVYEFAEFRVREEIDDPELRQRAPFWRKLVLEAAREQVELDEMPDDTSCYKEEWELLLECLAGCVLWDNDYEWQESQDLPPEESKRLYATLGIDDDYYTDVPQDPPDDQTNLYLDALMGLTASTR
ncbi:MAG: hypothetical protein U9N87_00045 [Planctomycetota bacterium]|nr:hypothetical protein [Planctomycetota bacterium]